MTKANPTVVNMKLERETKGTYVFAEVDKDGNPVDAAAGARVPSLYIRKNAFNGSGAPEKITLTIAAA